MNCLHHRQVSVLRASSVSGALVTVLLALGLWIAGALAGCSRPAEKTVSDRGDELRIVSFSPALSRMVVDLGLEQQIVGRTRYCRFLDESVPVVGDLYAVDYERLIEIDPTHVLIQAPKEGVDERLLELCDEHDWQLGHWSAVNTIEDIETVLRDMPDVLCSEDSDRYEALTARVAELLNEIALALTPAGEQGWREPVLLMYQVDPVGVFGRQTYLNDVLVRLGASNAMHQFGWVNLTLEDVVQLNPPAIVLIMPGADPDAEVTRQLGPVGTLDIAAVQQGRLAVLGHPDSMYPSTGIIGAAGELREILQGFAEDDASENGSAP